MRITFVISSLSAGGAERVAATMANYWAEKGWEITCLTMCGGDQSSWFGLHPKVTHQDLGAKPRSRSMPDGDTLGQLLQVLNHCSPAEQSAFIPDFNLLLGLRAAILESRPDTVISFIDVTNIRTLLATCGLRVPVIATEHCDPYHINLGIGWEGMRTRTYPQAKYLAVLTEEAAQYFSWFMDGKVRVVPNPISPGAGPAESDREMQHGKRRTLLAMGRLAYEKGFDLLLEAFALVAQRHPHWSLQIWGDGPLRSQLERTSESIGLGERVRFPGFTSQPFKVMRQADLFVVPSRCEGFSNVLVEAMACGLPAVSFDCPSGPRHIIRDGVDGILVPPQDVSALATALERLMDDETERVRLAAAATNVLERFGIEKVMSRWEELLLDQDTASNSKGHVA